MRTGWLEDVGVMDGDRWFLQRRVPPSTHDFLDGCMVFNCFITRSKLEKVRGRSSESDGFDTRQIKSNLCIFGFLSLGTSRVFGILNSPTNNLDGRTFGHKNMYWNILEYKQSSN